jgi:hypothetical protein
LARLYPLSRDYWVPRLKRGMTTERFVARLKLAPMWCSPRYLSPQPGLVRVAQCNAQVGQARLAMGRGGPAGSISAKHALASSPQAAIARPRDQFIAAALASLERDEFSSNRHPALALCLSMIFSENRYPLFGIMLYAAAPNSPSNRLRA